MRYTATITISLTAANDEEAKAKAIEIQQYVEKKYSFFFYLWTITKWVADKSVTVLDNKNHG